MTALAVGLMTGILCVGPVRADDSQMLQALQTLDTPLPYNKPLITDVAQPFEQTGMIPMPHRKPDFSMPHVDQLLRFGQAPVPARKPMGRRGSLLSESDAKLYEKIFAYQSMARWDKADELLGQLDDFRLRGHVLYQRYMHPTAYRASFDELAGWMQAYADHPEAGKIYKLAAARLPKNFDGDLRQPVKSSGVNGYLRILSEHDKRYRSSKERSAEEEKAIETLGKRIKKDLSKGTPTAAYNRLLEDPAAKLLDETEFDYQRAQIANGFMIAGSLDKAKTLAIESAERSAEKVPQAGWVGGLVAWQQKDYGLAASLFEITARSSYASDWTAAGGAYWASRAHMRAGHIKDVTMWLRRAADHPRTFYGLIATRALGWDFDFDWSMPEYTKAHKTALKKFPEAQRAMMLVQAGQYYLAEMELRRIDPKQGEGLTEALFAYANAVGLPSYSLRLASSVRTPEGRLYDAALYPLSPWTPQNGYKIDKALIHALIRQESRFNPMAESHTGATGLMQLMPATASFVSGRRHFKSREGRYNLTDPKLNLDIGQRYVETLFEQSHVGTELFSMVTAYNAGPGNLRRWKKEYSHVQNDPLLFVELIPLGETRVFVERVMANYWIYRMRMGQPTPSLVAVTEGDWARYVSLDGVEHANTGKTGISAGEQPYEVADKTEYEHRE